MTITLKHFYQTNKNLQTKNNNLVKHWHTNNYIDKNTYNKLITHNSITSNIYGKVKTNKPNNPIRPDISNTKGPLFKL